MPIIKKLNDKGIGLVEVIAALGITLMTVTALVSLALFTMRTSLNSKLTLEGSKTATREMELIRAYRDRSLTWADFLAGINSCESGDCHMQVDSLTPATGAATETIDHQSVTRLFRADIDPESSGDTNIVYVTVTVTWTVGGETKQTNLYTYLTNWRND